MVNIHSFCIKQIRLNPIAEHPKIFNHLTCDPIKAAAVDRVPFTYIRKMHGIDPVEIFINERPEIHRVIVLGNYMLMGYKVHKARHLFIPVQRKIAREGVFIIVFFNEFKRVG